MSQSVVAHPPESSSYNIEELVADWKWAYNFLAAGNLEQSRGQFVAVLNHAVVGQGADDGALREHVAQQQNVARERIVVLYVDDGEILT